MKNLLYPSVLIISIVFYLLIPKSIFAQCKHIETFKFESRGFGDLDVIKDGGKIDIEKGSEGHYSFIKRKRIGGDNHSRLQLSLPKEVWAGKKAKVEVKVKGEKILKGTEFYHTGHLNFASYFSDDPYNPQISARYPRFIGTFPWKTIKHSTTIPKDADKIFLRIGLQGCSGTLFIDDFAIYLCK